MFAFEALIIYKLWLSAQEFTRVTRDINTALASLEERRRENAEAS